jgi:hypothetical protein
MIAWLHCFRVYSKARYYGRQFVVEQNFNEAQWCKPVIPAAIHSSGGGDQENHSWKPA